MRQILFIPPFPYSYIIAIGVLFSYVDVEELDEPMLAPGP
jgi:hypothetical protein